MANNRKLLAGETESNLRSLWSYAPPAGGYTNSTSNVEAKAAVSGKRNYVTGITISAGVALATASELVIKTGSTVLFRLSLPAAVIPPTTIDIPADTPLVGGVNEAINIAAVTLFATGNLSVNLQGYTA